MFWGRVERVDTEKVELGQMVREVIDK